MVTDQRGMNRATAEILARVISPERVDWPQPVALTLLRLQFADTDLSRFHKLLARYYGDTLTEAQVTELESYLFVNCVFTMIHDRARRSLEKTKPDAQPH